MDVKEWIARAFKAARNALPAEIPEWVKKPEWIAVWLGVLTLVVVVVQIRIMRRQTRLMTRQDGTMKHQTALMGKQLEIVEKQDALLARRAKLRMIARFRGQDIGDRRQIEFRVENYGERTAEWYYWFLYVPIEQSNRYKMQVAEGKDLEKSTVTRGDNDDVQWVRYSGHVEYPMAPTRSGAVAVMHISNKVQGFSVEWQLVAEDGAFPGGDEFGKVELPLG